VKFRLARWAGHVASMGETMNDTELLVGGPLVECSLGRSRSEDNNKRFLGEMDRNVSGSRPIAVFGIFGSATGRLVFFNPRTEGACSVSRYRKHNQVTCVDNFHSENKYVLAGGE